MICREKIMSTEPMRLGSAYPIARRWPRYKLTMPVRVVLPHTYDTRLIYGRGTELNEGGLAVFAAVELDVGQQVEVEFTPPYSGHPVRVRTIIRNRKGYFYGLEFHVTTPQEAEHVAHVRSILSALGSRIP
jgi:PilZ domain